MISLGAITGPAGARVPLIKGIFTAADPSDSYRLTSYFGTAFSIDGGLKIHGQVTGDAVAGTNDIDLLSLHANTTVQISDSLTMGASIKIAGKVQGTVDVANVAGDLSVGAVSGLLQVGQIGGSLTVESLSGTLLVGQSALPGFDTVTIAGNVGSNAKILSPESLALKVGASFLGLAAVSGELDLVVGKSISNANVHVGGDMTLNVTGDVSKSSIIADQQIITGSGVVGGIQRSQILAGTGIDLAIGKNLSTSRISAGANDLDLIISAAVKNSQLLAGGDSTISTTFGVSKSTIVPDGRLNLTVGQAPQGTTAGVGNLLGSLIGSKSTGAVVAIGGKVTGSQFTTGTDLDLQVGSTIKDSSIGTGNNLNLNTNGLVTSSRIAVGSDAIVNIGGRLSSSALLISNNLSGSIWTA